MGDVSAEPSMEDILSSIKRIIAEDVETGGASRARRRPSPQPIPAEAAEEDDVLELNEPAPDSDVPSMAAPVAAAPVSAAPAEKIISDEAAEVSYLADTVILMRYFEVSGTVRQAVSVVKKRSGDHERTIRECKVQKGGLFVGEPLRDFQGVLTGVPHYVGSPAPLLEDGAGNYREGVMQQSSEAGHHVEVGTGANGRKRRRKKSSA